MRGAGCGWSKGRLRPAPRVGAGGVGRTGCGRMCGSGGCRHAVLSGALRASGDISLRPGTILCGRGPSTPSGTGFLSPNARTVPGWCGPHPAAWNVPGGLGLEDDPWHSWTVQVKPVVEARGASVLAPAEATRLVSTPSEVYTQIAQNDQFENSERAVRLECAMTVTMESKTYLPEEDVTGRFAELVTELETSSGAAPRLTVNGETIDLPPAVAEALLQVVDAMRRGLAVTVAPQGQRLTTQEAADMLGISRPTLVRMLEAGEIPFEKVRRHRRLFLTDVLEFRERQRRVAHEALSDMVADAQAMGAYDEDPAEAHQVLKNLRSLD